MKSIAGFAVLIALACAYSGMFVPASQPQPREHHFELRFANRFYVGPGYVQKGESWFAAEHNGYHVERRTAGFYDKETDCLAAQQQLKQNNPRLWWASCRQHSK